jgi:hypothetical protein
MTKKFREALEANLQNAIERREEARALWSSVDTRDRKARVCAEENLHFWQGKVANLDALLKRETVIDAALKGTK